MISHIALLILANTRQPVDGNGKDPGFKELVRVGVQAGMSKDSCEEIAQNVQKCVQQMLGEYISTR